MSQVKHLKAVPLTTKSPVKSNAAKAIGSYSLPAIQIRHNDKRAKGRTGEWVVRFYLGDYHDRVTFSNVDHVYPWRSPDFKAIGFSIDTNEHNQTPIKIRRTVNKPYVEFPSGKLDAKIVFMVPLKIPVFCETHIGWIDNNETVWFVLPDGVVLATS